MNLAEETVFFEVPYSGYNVRQAKKTIMTNFLLQKEAKSNQNSIRATLVFLLLLAAFMRLYGITHQSLWNDELSSWSKSNQESVIDVIDKGVRTDVHPPGYQILLYYVQMTLGDSELALRLPSAFAGILCVLAVYALGKFLYSSKEGLVAAALMAVSWAPIFYSQEARPYSLLLLFSILSTHAWLRVARGLSEPDQFRWSLAFLYIFVAAATSYTHYYGVILIFLQGVYTATAFVRDRIALARGIILYLAIVVLYIPWLSEFFIDITESKSWMSQPGFHSLASYWYSLFSRLSILSLVAFSACIFLAFTELIKIQRPVIQSVLKRLQEPTVILLLWLSVPVLIVFSKSLVSTPVFSERNLIICLPAAYLLVAHSLLRYSNRISCATVSVIAMGLSLLLASHLIFSMDYYSKVHKQQFIPAISTN